jgi:hypothetical protein
VGQYRQHGIDVPIYSNATEDQDPREMVRVLDLIGVNHYPTRDYGLVANEHQRLLEHVRALSSVSPVPYVAELESGIWHGYHYTKGIPYPEHYRFTLLTILAGGAVGWNWYMLHDRDNWYMSPLNARGRKRVELWDLFRRFVEVEREVEPFAWERCARTAVTHHQAHLGRGFRAVEHEDAGDVWRALYRAGIDYRVWTLMAPGEPPGLLLYGGGDLMDEEIEAALARYMEAGGHLVLLQRTPVVEAGGRRRRALGIPAPAGVESQGYMNTFFKDYEVRLGGAAARVDVPERVHVYGRVPGEPVSAYRRVPREALNDNVLDEYQLLVGLDAEDALTVGFHEARGRGSLTVLGTPASPDLLVTLHAFLGVGIPARPLTPGVLAVLYRKGDRHYLIGLNTGWEDRAATVLLDPAEFPGLAYTCRDVLEERSWGVAFRPDAPRSLTVDLRRRSGCLLEIRPG